MKTLQFKSRPGLALSTPRRKPPVGNRASTLSFKSMLVCELGTFHAAVKAAGGERGVNPVVQVEAQPRIVHSAVKAASGRQGTNPVVVR